MGAELGCYTVWTTYQGVEGPKVPTAGGKKGEPRQYIQLGRTEKVSAHRLSWVFENPDGNFDLLADEKVEASHLCGHSRCCNGLHISFEPRAYNQSRSYCLWQWEDRAVSPPRMIDVCTHLPKCLCRGNVYEAVIAPWTATKKLEGEPDLPPLPRRLEEQSVIDLPSLPWASDNPPESEALNSDSWADLSDDTEMMMASLV